MPRLWSSLHAMEWIIGEPSLRLAPTHEALQRGIATIEGAGGKVLLCSDEGSGPRTPTGQCASRLRSVRLPARGSRHESAACRHRGQVPPQPGEHLRMSRSLVRSPGGACGHRRLTWRSPPPLSVVDCLVDSGPEV